MARLAHLLALASVAATLAAAQGNTTAIAVTTTTAPNGPANATARCAWSQLAGEPCATNRGCVNNPDLKLCFDASCFDLTTVDACRARDGCVWNGTRCKDYNLNFGIPDNFYCAAVKDARVCNQISNCAWAGATSVCLSRPGFQPPAPLNPNCTAATIDACDRAKGCVFIANRCFYPRCRVQKNATQCGRFSGSCVWVNDVQQCVDVSFSQAPDDCASWRHPATCIATRRCGWTRDQCVLGLNKEANRVGGCAFVANPQGCNASNGCVFEAQINRCLDPNCPRLETADKCRTVSGCSWYRNECVDNNLAFGTHPCSNITNSDVCRGKCGWSPSTRTCLPLAGTCSMSTVSNCPSGCTADQTTGVCAFSGCPATALNGEECDRSKGCVMTQNGKCFDYNVVFGKYPCERVKSKDLCGGACQWNNGTCIPGGEGTPCSQLRQDDKRFCPERCGYEEKLKMCYERRCGGLSRADCFAQTSYGCAWRNSICLDQNVQFGFYECRLSTSPQLCGGRCAWQNNQCATYTACAFGQQGDPNKCPRPRCSFEPQVGFCVDPACGQQTTAEGCADRQGCAWRDGKCSDYNVAMKAYDCARVQNASFCGGRCRYDTASSKCVFDPSKVPCSELRQGDKQQCDSARCTFDEGSRLCYDLNCSLITVAADCAKRQGCSWKGGEKGKCADRNVQYRRYPCNGVQREEACQGQCEWDANQTDVNRRCRPRSWLPTGCTVEMRDAEVQALNACLDPIRAVSRLGANVTLAFIRGEVEKVCGNATCLAALNATKCATQFLAYAKTLCSRRNSSDAYCGVSVLSQQQAQCGSIAPTDPGSPASAEQACNSTEACRFNPRANRCEFRPTQDLLALQCSPCVRQYKDIENLVDQRRGVQLEKDDPMSGFDVMCAKVKGSYCMTRFNVAQFQDFKPRDLAGDMLTKLCADDTSATDQRCFQKVANAVMKRRTAAAQQSMLECSRTTGLTGGPDCSADFQNAMQQQKEFDATVASMCTKTTDGRLCLTLPKALANKSQELQGCYAAVVDRGDACSTSCDTLLKAEIDAWGCCAGTLQRIFGDADIKDRVARELTVAQKQAPPDTQNAQAGGSTEVQRSSRLLLQSPQGTTGGQQPQGPGTQSPQGTTGSAGQPQGPGTQSPQGTNGGAGPGTQSPQQGGGNNNGGQNSNGPQQQAPVNKRESGYLANLRMCTSFGENVKNTIGNTCNVTFAPVAQKRRVYLTIAWSALQSDSTLNSAISDAVQEDMQAMMGISSDKVDNFTIGEATGVTVTVTNTTARGLKVLTTSSGTYAEVSVKDSSTSATTDATGDYDTEISSQSATLSSTSDALESQCSDSTACVDSSSSSLISYSATQSDITTTAAPTTTTTAGKTSASASLVAQLALAAAAIVALAF